jgi:hypothetical protein
VQSLVEVQLLDLGELLDGDWLDLGDENEMKMLETTSNEPIEQDILKERDLQECLD